MAGVNDWCFPALLKPIEPADDVALGEGRGKPGDGTPLRMARGRASLVLIGIGANLTVDGAEEATEGAAIDEIEGTDAAGMTGVDSFSMIEGVVEISAAGTAASTTGAGEGALIEADRVE